jgi:hypothetical protein
MVFLDQHRDVKVPRQRQSQERRTRAPALHLNPNFKGKVKGDGEECPLHTGVRRAEPASFWQPSGLAKRVPDRSRESSDVQEVCSPAVGYWKLMAMVQELPDGKAVKFT